MSGRGLGEGRSTARAGRGPLGATAPAIGPLIEAIGMTIPFIRLIKIRICSAWNARLFID
jgi:hypothetical protein